MSLVVIYARCTTTMALRFEIGTAKDAIAPKSLDIVLAGLTGLHPQLRVVCCFRDGHIDGTGLGDSGRFSRTREGQKGIAIQRKPIVRGTLHEFRIFWLAHNRTVGLFAGEGLDNE